MLSSPSDRSASWSARSPSAGPSRLSSVPEGRLGRALPRTSCCRSTVMSAVILASTERGRRAGVRRGMSDCGSSRWCEYVRVRGADGVTAGEFRYSFSSKISRAEGRWRGGERRKDAASRSSGARESSRLAAACRSILSQRNDASTARSESAFKRLPPPNEPIVLTLSRWRRRGEWTRLPSELEVVPLDALGRRMYSLGRTGLLSSSISRRGLARRGE